MAYFCKDCSYRGKKSGQAGECPACGSFNLQRVTNSGKTDVAPSKWRLVALVGLWIIFITLVLRKLDN